MFAHERHRTIRQIVKKHRRLSFAELQELVNASPATLRRDLTALEQSGEILRVHGGVLDPAYVRAEVSFDERLLRQGRAKKAIAAKAASLVLPGSSVFIDAGSTCLEAGKALLGRKDVRIITHSATLIAAALHCETEVLCIGGNLRKVSGAFTGGNALGSLSVIHADLAFVGASGLSFEGCSTTEASEAEIKKSILERSTRNVLLADSSKWQNPSTIRFAHWNEFHDWVREKPIEKKADRELRKSGITIHSTPE